MKIVFGVAAGIVVGVLCIMGIEFLGHAMFPPPPGIDFHDPAVRAELTKHMPLGALVFVIAGWLLGSLAGASTANAVAKKALAGWIVALFVVAGGVFTMMAIPHPVWMWVAGITLPLLAGWLAQRLVKAPAAPASPLKPL